MAPLNFPYYAGFISEWLGAVSVAWLLSLNSHFKSPQVGFKYARRDGLIALSLFALILLFSFIFYSQNAPALPASLQPIPAPWVDLKQAAFVAALCLAAFLVALAVRRQPLRSIGWNPALLRIGFQLGLATALLTIFLRNRVMDLLRGVDSTGLLLLLLALGVSLAEETIFRGYIQLRLTWWLGDWPGLVLTAALFALWHLPAWLNHVPVETGVISAALTFAQGLVLGWIMKKSGSVAAPTLYRAVSIWINFFFLG